MEKFKRFAKYLLLLIILVTATLLALPKINLNIGETNINFNLADDFLIPNRIAISDFRKGDGLYPTYIVNAQFPAETAQEVIDSTYSTIKSRIEIAMLGDISTKLVTKDSITSIEFEYPAYYSNPVDYTNWLTAKGSIVFATNEDSPQVLTINDYDIVSDLKLEYSTYSKTHLSFYLSDTAGAISSSVYSSGQESYLMYIDGVPSFHIVDFDGYVDTNLNRFRAITVMATLLDSSNPDIKIREKEISDFVYISRSYFASEQLPVAFVVSESATEVAPSTKPAPLSTIAFGVALVSIFTILILSVIRRLSTREVLVKLTWMIIFSIINIALHKYVGAVLGVDMLIGYLLSTAIVGLLIVEWENISRPIRTTVGLILMFGFITKFYNLSFSLATVLGTVVISLTALVISSFYRELISWFILLPKNLSQFTKLKSVRLNLRKSK